MKQTLQLRLSQHLTLTPQVQQSIRLLQLSTVELNQEIERLLQENPLLEREDSAAEPPPPQPGADLPPGNPEPAGDSPPGIDEAPGFDAEDAPAFSGGGDGGEEDAAEGAHGRFNV